MSFLLVGDLHLTTLPRDSYRWRIFDALREAIKNKKPKHLVLLGDLTHEKDRHTAELVNKICTAITSLRGVLGGLQIQIVRGNHDGNNPEWPYFRFLDDLPDTHFYAQPTEMHGARQALVLPHSRDPLKEWEKIKFEDYKTVFAHVTVEGAESESGVALRSEVAAEYFRKRRVKVYSGDVHVPQKIGPVRYVGAPYPIRFGDCFQPQLWYLEDDDEGPLELTTIHRLMLDIEDASELHSTDVSAGDQAKVRLHLGEERLCDWQEQRRKIVSACSKLGLELISVEVIKEKSTKPMHKIKTAKRPTRILADYIRAQNVEESLAAFGEELLQQE